MFCMQCGNQMNDGAKFCPKCGARVEQPTAPANANQTSVNQHPAVNQNTAVNQNSSVNQNPAVNYGAGNQNASIYQNPAVNQNVGAYQNSTYQNPPVSANVQQPPMMYSAGTELTSKEREAIAIEVVCDILWSILGLGILVIYSYYSLPTWVCFFGLILIILNIVGIFKVILNWKDKEFREDCEKRKNSNIVHIVMFIVMVFIYLGVGKDTIAQWFMDVGN